ncbi:MAG TPA: hypothetical protein DCM64_11450 [Gammaproteobacteria bacterium]|nr:hypothetical protein [Gammaproteobacteria bacterium]MDP6733705.1 hypothetical protein [Gammaproteobacteria bacterium]HAJ77054.1 hypothetical protein [Gammaproteobacteria bacterium]
MRYYSSLTVITFLASLAAGSANSQQSVLTETELELARIRGDIAQLEAGSSRLDRGMLELLDQFSQQLMETGRYSEAHQVLDQAVQIIRVNEGLYSPAQFPYVLRRIETYGNQGDWRHAREMMEHMDWLLIRGENTIDTALMDSILNLVDIHLWGVANDSISMQSFHFRAAQRLNSIAIRAATAAWGEDDQRLPALIYKQLVQQYLQTVAVEVGGGTGIGLRRYSNSGLARSRSDARAGYYYSGLRLLSRIQRVYSDQPEPNSEGMAIAEVYLADWHVLFGNSEAATFSYARSNTLLLEAGIEQREINRFFAHPKLIPALDFVDSLDSGLESIDDPISSNSLEEGVSSFNFQQWSSQFPHYLAPVDFDVNQFSMPEEGFAMFTFSLTGLEEIGRWYRGRWKNEVSSPQNVELVTQRFNQPMDWLELENAIQDFRFRPKLIDGVPQSVTATLLYQLAN